MKSVALIFIVFLPLLFFTSLKKEKVNRKILILSQFKNENWNMPHADTIYLSYWNCEKTINDSIKHCLNNPCEVTTILIAQPSEIIKSVNFNVFTNLSTLILAGNDYDFIDSLSFDFLNNKSIKQIISSGVWVDSKAPMHCRGSFPDPRCLDPVFKKYIKARRSDIKVKFYVMGKYNKEGWGD